MSKANITLVSASAGSGKTFKLMELVHEEVSAGLKARGLLAVTYTKKAAEELKQRIREKLIESGKIEAARGISAARIGTVHSVCAELLRRYAFEDGSSPRQKVIDEVEAERVFQNSLNEVLTDENLNLLNKFSGVFATDLKSLIDSIEMIALIMRQNNLGADSCAECIAESIKCIDFVLDAPNDSSTQGSLALALKKYISEHPLPPDPTQATGKAHKAVSDAADNIAKGRRLSWHNWISLTKLEPGAKSKDYFKPILDAASSFMSNPELRADLADLIKFSFNVAAAAATNFADNKKSLGVLDYGDLEQKTLHLLERQEVQNQLKVEVEVLFVDEFQDTNPIQLAIFLKLSSICRKTVWVGDLKQSIYKFRGADPILMNSIASELAKIGKLEILDKNWRSTEPIVSFVNDLFSQAFELDGLTAKQVQQIPQWKTDSKNPFKHPGLDVWDGSGKNIPERTKKLAQGISELLKESHVVKDRDTDELRSLRPGDVAVLCRANEACEEVAEVLKSLGIESSVVGGNLLEQPEVSVALSAYRFLMSSRDTIAAAEIVLALGGNRDEWLQMAIDEKSVEEWHPTLAKLTKARELITEMSIREKLDLAMSVISIETWVESMSQGVKRLSHLAALRQEIKNYEETCQASYVPCTDLGFLEYIERQDSKLPAASHSDAVQVGTYHSTKGLEWPVVILTSLEKKPRVDDLFGIRTQLKLGATFDPASPLANRVVNYLPWPFAKFSAIPQIDTKMATAPMTDELAYQSEAESRRVLYVGMTRARERLVLFNTIKDPIEESTLGVLKDKQGKALLSFPTDGKSILVGGVVHEAVSRTITVSPEPTKPAVAAKQMVKVLPQAEPIDTQQPSLYLQPSQLSSKNATSLVKSVKVGRYYHWGDNLVFKTAVQKSESSEEETRRDVVGSAMHIFLGVDDVQKQKTERVLQAEEIVESWSVKSALDTTAMVEASDRLFLTINTLWPKSEIYREIPMDLEFGGSIIRGSIDCLIVTESEVAIIDHKTSIYSFSDFDKVAASYQLQLEAYAQAARKHFAGKTVSMWLHNPNGWMAEVV